MDFRRKAARTIRLIKVKREVNREKIGVPHQILEKAENNMFK
jgi:hypothetical protein